MIKHCLIKILMEIVNQCDLELEQVDAKITILPREVDKRIYMEQPTGFPEDKSMLCLLKKYLYELKKLQNKWYHGFDEFNLEYGFLRNGYDNCVSIFKWNV